MDNEVADFQVAQVREERLGEVAALLRRLPLLFEDVGLDIDLKLGVAEPESPRQLADAHQNGRGMRVLGAINGNREDLVFLQDLNDSLGKSGTASYEQHRVAALTRLPKVRHPVLHATTELLC